MASKMTEESPGVFVVEAFDGGMRHVSEAEIEFDSLWAAMVYATILETGRRKLRARVLLDDQQGNRMLLAASLKD